jgi:hypothetical protein
MSGIVKDPWKVVEPKIVKPVVPSTKKNINEVDFALEKSQEAHYDIRGNNGSLRVDCVSGDIALKKVVLFLKYVRHEIGDEILVDNGIGFKAGDDIFNVHDFDEKTSIMKAGDVVVYFVNQTHDQGLSRVVALLIEMVKNHKDVYKKYGIEPIQR